jgi:hypothetical protein
MPSMVIDQAAYYIRALNTSDDRATWRAPLKLWFDELVSNVATHLVDI